LQRLQSENNLTQDGENFLERLEKLSLKVWEKELFNNPFLLDLYEGKLPRQKFAEYLVQDYHYLKGFARAMAMAAAKAEDLFIIRAFYTHLRITIDYEFPRVWKMMTRFGVKRTGLENSSPKPGTEEYTSFLLNTCANCSPAEVVAAIYPCNFSYREIGKKIRPALLRHYNVPEAYISFNLYQRRVFTESAANTLKVLAMGASRASKAQEKKIFAKFYEATKFERGFWDQNY
jgi:thiaminase (transcriptional activator TenA)